MISSEVAYDALCIWEYLIENRNREGISYAFEQLGTCALRSWALHCLAPACEEAWALAEADYDGPFDWEFVSDWIDANVDWYDTSQIFNLTFIPKQKPDFFHLGAEAEAECVSK